MTGRALLLAMAILATPPALAATYPGESLPDPAQEARARDLGRELRCLVCQNQSIDDSDADLAKDLRRIVRERIAAGGTDAEIRDFLVARYGDFVLLEPPLRPETWLLWFGPAAVLVAGAGLAAALWRRRRPDVPADLSPEERAKLDRLLAGETRAAP